MKERSSAFALIATASALPIRTASTGVAVAYAFLGLGSAGLGAASANAAPSDGVSMRDAAYAQLVIHVERVTAELAGSPAAPAEDTEYARIVSHVPRVTAKLSAAQPQPAAAKRSGDRVTVGSVSLPPLSRRKPPDRDRSDEIVALLKKAGAANSSATSNTVRSLAAWMTGAAVRPAISPAPEPSQMHDQPAVADSLSLSRPPAAGSDPYVEPLRSELEARDRLIANLLQRVEQLERRIVLSANQLDEAVGGAGPISLFRRPVAETVPPAPGAPAAGAADPAEPDGTASQPVQMAQAQPPAAAEGQAAPATTQAPGQFEVDEAAIDRALERTLVQEGVLLLPFGQAEIQPSFTYTRREIDAPTFVTIDGQTFLGEQDIRRDEFQTTATLRVGLPFDSQIEVGMPYNYVDESVRTTVGNTPATHNSESGHGIGDVSVGLAKTLLQEGAGWWPDLIARGTWGAGTGKTRDSGVFLGGGFNQISGSLSAVKRQDPLAFVGTVSYGKTFEHDDIEPGDELGFSLGTVLAASPETSLSFFFNQTFADDAKIDGDNVDGSDQVIGTFSIGAATILGRNVLLSVTGEIGLTDDAPDYAIGVALPIRFDLPFY